MRLEKQNILPEATDREIVVEGSPLVLAPIVLVLLESITGLAVIEAGAFVPA